MRCGITLSLGLAFSLGSLPLSAFAQTSATASDGRSTTTGVLNPTSIASALTGGSIPQAVTFSDMSAPGQKWVRFRLAAGLGDTLAIYAIFLSYFSNSGDMLGEVGYYYTSGQQIGTADTPYLVAYHLVPSVPDAAIGIGDARRQAFSAARASPDPRQ